MRLDILRVLELTTDSHLPDIRKKVVEDYALPLSFSVGLLVIWEYVVVSLDVPSYLLPLPSAIFRRLIVARDLLFDHTMVTLFESITGFILASLLGIGIAVGIAHSRVVERTLYPYVVIAKVIPIVAIAPLLMLWFGFGLTPKVVIAALISFFPIVVNTVKGLKSTDPQVLRLMRSLSATTFQTFIKIRLPSSLPYIFAAFKISITLSVVGAIVGELVGADRGLGHLIMVAEAYLDTEMMFAAVTMSAVLGVSLFFVMSLLERCFLSWHESIESETV